MAQLDIAGIDPKRIEQVVTHRLVEIPTLPKVLALPIFGAVAFLDHSWSEAFTSSLGWSMVDIDNSDAQAANAYRQGHYAIANLLYVPVTNVLMGVEYQFGSRENHADDFNFTGHRLQFSFKYSFSQTFGGKP